MPTKQRKLRQGTKEYEIAKQTLDVLKVFGLHKYQKGLRTIRYTPAGDIIEERKA